MHPLEKFEFCPACGSKSFRRCCKQSKKCSDCGFQYYLNQIAAVAAFVVKDNRELLVCTRGKNPAKGTLDLPGGFVDIGETAEEAVAREMAEELGLEIEAASYMFSIPNRYLYSNFEVKTLDLFFEVKAKNLALVEANDDVANVEFIELEKIDASLFGLESIKIAVERFLTAKKQKGAP